MRFMRVVAATAIGVYGIVALVTGAWIVASVLFVVWAVVMPPVRRAAP
ncbi:MAG: hypothetical protein M0020_01415 [Actinomycetota bacterium]|nr:hypothetical protein [Actinomycetota bacterium]